jgi:ubiquinone/menaquinone biosynthesis C-methylase UbiE
MPDEERQTVLKDEATAAYFDSYVPEYGVERFARAADFLRREAGPGASLIDIGCGTGNTLAHLQAITPVTEVAGLDVSARCLEKTRERLGCVTYQGSIFDPSVVHAVGPRFDFAVLAAVLHHLIGRTRQESRGYARAALHNAARLLSPGGHLLVVEPSFHPPLAMDAVFYVKKAVSRLTTRRVPILGYWNNIGAPVVSYYTHEELREMLESVPGLEIVADHADAVTLGPLLGRVFRRDGTTLVARSSFAPGG